MQTSSEVIDSLLRKKPAERIGLHDGIWGDTLRQWADEEGYPRDENGNPASPVDYFDFDLQGVGGWFDKLPIRAHEEVVEETEEWITRRNGAGAALKYWKHKSGTPEHIDFRMTSRAVWERDYRPLLTELDRERINIDAARQALQDAREKDRWAFYGDLFLWELMRCSMGDVCMLESLILDPDWIHDYNRVYTDLYKAHYALLIEEAGKPDGVWIYEDLGYANGLYCSPQTFADLIFPYYTELVDFFHGYDLPVVLHACGGITDAVPQIVDAGFDGLNPMQAAAGCDVIAYAEEYGDKLAFFGGLDKIVFESGDRDWMRREVDRIISGIKSAGGRYVFGSDHSISTNVSLADFQYVIDLYREQMWYD